MIPSQEHHDKRSTPTRVSISPMGGVVPERDPLVSRNESASSTTGDPKLAGFSEELHNAPPHVADGEVTLRFTEGASYAELGLAETIGATTQSRGRGGRSAIRGFSRPSQLRLRRLTAQVPRDSRALLATLTYPTWYRMDPETAKRHDLEKFRKRFERKFGPHAVIWRQESCGGILHFHLLLFFDGRLTISRARLAEIRGWVARTWWEVCGRICREHLETGTSVERPRSLLRVLKYISKPEPPIQRTDYSDDGPPADAGRRWGVWRQELLGIVWVKRRVSRKDAFQLRRILRRLLRLKSRPGVVNFKIFVRDELVKRLLEHLGYPAPG
jgi:hypothetical protein